MRAWLFVFIACIVAPLAHGQELQYAEQGRVELEIDPQGGAVVRHSVADLAESARLELVGEPSNLQAASASGSVDVTVAGDDIVIPAGLGDIIIQYELPGFISLQDGVWTRDFFYPETVAFTVPDGANLAFINEQPLYTAEDKRFACHGCGMVLEYAFDEPEKTESAVWEDREFSVVLRSFTDVENFEFSQPEKSISFDVDGAGMYVTAVFDLELLGKPYVALHNGDKMQFHGYDITEERVGLTMRPDSPGRVTIIGTTVIPEFSVLAPLVAGFMALCAYPLLKRISFH